MAFYRPTRELCRKIAEALVTRYSASPDVDLRWSPLPGLGNPKRPKKGWPILGGPCLTKAQVQDKNYKELQCHVKLLDLHLRSLLPKRPRFNLPSAARCVKKSGCEALSGAWLQKKCDVCEEKGQRELVLKAVAGGTCANCQLRRKHELIFPPVCSVLASRLFDEQCRVACVWGRC